MKEFEPHRWLRNAHLMTIAGAFWRRKFPRLPAGEARLFDISEPPLDIAAREPTETVAVRAPKSATLANTTQDALHMRSGQAAPGKTNPERPGTQVRGYCHWQKNPREHATLVLVHGLEGSSDSGYILGTAEKAFVGGFNVVRLNQRNCGGTEHLTPHLYHSGRSADVRERAGVTADRRADAFTDECGLHRSPPVAWPAFIITRACRALNGPLHYTDAGGARHLAGCGEGFLREAQNFARMRQRKRRRAYARVFYGRA